MGLARPPRNPGKGPARGLILSRDRARRATKKAGGGQLKGAWQIQFVVKRDMAYDLDVRKILDYVSYWMMEFYRNQLRKGKRASGRGALPATRQKTREDFGGGRYYGFRSGYMADHWQRLTIRGSSLRSSVLIKPYGGFGGRPLKYETKAPRAFIIRVMLDRTPPVDFQSVRGEARKEFAKRADEAIAMGWGDVKTPLRARTSPAQLPDLRGGR